MEFQSISRRWQRRVLAVELYPLIVWGEQSESNRHLSRSQRGALSLSYVHHGWSGQLDLDQRPPGSKPGTLSRLSYTQDVWSTRSDSNTRPHAYQTCALPTELLVFGNPDRSGLAWLALRAHYVRLSALRASVEPAISGLRAQRLNHSSTGSSVGGTHGN